MLAEKLIFEANTRHTATDPGANAWVQANAGSGKTDLLTRRVLRLLLSGVLPSRLLCLTYTKAAAAEMLARVHDTAAAWAVMPEPALQEALGKLTGNRPEKLLLESARSLFASLIDAPTGLNIHTIHAFCQSVLKRFPLEAGIVSFFRVLDERTSAELIREAALRLYDATASDEGLSAALGLLASRMSEGGVYGLLEEVAGNRRALASLLAYYGNVEHAVAALHDEIQMGEEPALLPSPNEQVALRAAIDILEKTDKKTNIETAAALRGLEDKSEIYYTAFITDKGTPRKTIFTKNALPQELGNTVLVEQERACVHYAWRQKERLAKASAALLRIADRLLTEYNELKQRRALLDYDDLILSVMRLLERPGIAPWVMYKLDGGIDHVLIDEAQDTSAEQWRIVKALTQEYFAGEGRETGPRTIFAVGDNKQSIYSFQGADPAAFAHMRAYFAQAAADAAAPWAEMALPESFRSTQPVLTAVDAVFAQSYGVRHILTREKTAGVAECWPLVEEDGGRSGISRLANMIVAQVAEWLERGEMLASRGRPLHAGDIMILVRTRGPLARALIRGFKRRGIPVAGADRMVLTENLAVQDIMALGAFLLLPEDDYNLACLLKSPLCGLSEEQLFSLANTRGELSLWAQLSAYKDRDETFAQAHAYLSTLLGMADYMPPYELFAHALDELGGRTRIVGRMGAEYEEAIDEFFLQTLAFEQLHTPSLQGLLHWLVAHAAEVKRDMEGSQGQLRIMTVHAAKGLQAPVVILPDTVSLPAKNNIQHHPVLWSKQEEGAFPMLPRGTHSEQASTLIEERHAAEMEEYQRLLYVAMTRAEDRLYLCGAKGRKEPDPHCWHSQVAAALSGIAETADTPAGPGLRLQSTQEKDVAHTHAASRSDIAPLPPELLLPPAPEPQAASFTPSHADHELPGASPLESNRFLRGTRLHRLLQHLPSLPPEKRASVAERLLHDMPQEERQALLNEANTLFAAPALAPFFAAGSLAEVALAGRIMRRDVVRNVSGQIDRLAVGERMVWILDYKTHARPPRTQAEVPRAILSQMAAYKALVEQIYTERGVHCALLWTAEARLMPLDASLLDSYI